MRDIIILGTGGNCLDLVDLIEDANRAGAAWRLLGFLDDDPARQGLSYRGLPVLGPLSSAPRHAGASFLNGIGSPSNHTRKLGIIAATGLPADRFATVVHPSAAVSRTANLGRGVALFPGVFVGHGATLGDHVIALPNAIVSHDCEIGAGTCIAGGASVSGGVKVGEACYLGTHCSIAIGAVLGRHALVGMGAVVLKDVAESTVVAGNPARVLRANP
jgi:sugar O-acyltransferase (sialic acid O-acetyltransferase NeuD family)